MSNLSSHNIFVRYFDSLNICNKTRYQIKKLNDSRLLEALTALWYKSWCPKQDNWIDPVPQLAANIPGHALRPEAFQDRAQPLIFSLNIAVLLKVLNIILWQCWDRLLNVLWVLDGIFRRRLRTASFSLVPLKSDSMFFVSTCTPTWRPPNMEYAITSRESRELEQAAFWHKVKVV